MMQIKWDDFKKAVGWLEEHCNESKITVEFNNTTDSFDLKSFDRNNKPVTVKIAKENTGKHVAVISEQALL